MMHSRRYLARPVFVLTIAAGMLLAGCSSDPSPGSDGGADSSASADPSQEYAPGIPTLDALYASSENAPPATGPKLAPNKSVIFLSCGQLAPACAGVGSAINKVSEQIGWKSRVIDGKFGVNDGYNSGMRQAIAAKPDAIVVHAIGCSEILQPLKEAKEAGIPVINIQAPDCDDPKNPGGPSEPLFINMQFNKDFKSAVDFFYQAGFNQASYLINATKGKATILRDRYTGNAQGQYQAAGQDAALAKCSECKVVSTVDWVAADGGAGGVLTQKFTTILTQHPEANAALLSYDSVATSYGLSKAIVDAGRQKSMVVVGGEGFAPAQQLIRDGAGLTADVGQSVEWSAWGALDTVNRHLNASPLVPQGIGFRIIDASHNLSPKGEDYSPPNPPIDLKGTYFKSWGVN
jgi:ribose transport system substrate-binding protein